MINRLYLLLCLLAQPLAAEFKLFEGELNGAPYKVATPEGWAGGPVLFIVNGWRPANAPHIADLDLTDPFILRLLEGNWAVGRTAFKQNGVDHEAHIIALRELKEWIQEKLGPIDTVLMEGESTAGTLVLHIAEKYPGLADGVIAIGAFIELEDKTSADFLTARPQIPAFLMSNLSEIEGPVAYVAFAEKAPVSPSLRPLRRPGHVNINWVERWHAIKDITKWLEDDEFPLLADGTRSVPQRQTGTHQESDALINRVSAINPFFGNAYLEYHPEEFKAAGIVKGTTFEIEAHGNRWPVYYGESYGDVELGEWVAFPTADDRILLVRNHKSAIKTAGLIVGDVVKVYAKQP